MNDFYAGISAGIASTLICNPFDIVRTNIQVNKNLSVISFIKTKYLQNGIRYFYNGIGIGLLTIPSFWSIYFPLYSKIKNYKLNTSIAAYISCNIAATITCPLWVIRQKIQLDNKFSLVNYYKTNPIGAFYTGLGTTYVINLGFGIQIPVYEYLKKQYSNTTVNIFLMTSISKIISSIVMYPLDTVRVLSRENPKASFKIIFINLNKDPKLYYRGLLNYIIRSIPYHTSTFCVFEYFKNHLINR